MADTEPTLLRNRPDTPPLPRRPGGGAVTTSDEFRHGFGEDLAEVLNLDHWRAGRNLDEEYRRIEREVAEAVTHEKGYQRRVREEVLPGLPFLADAPKGAGHYTDVRLAHIREVHSRLLFSGAVEACDGTCQKHDMVPLTMYQVGASLVSYRGNQGSWCQRLFRRDLRQQHGNPVEELQELLQQRGRRAAQNHRAGHDALSELAHRAVMTYGERAVLARKSSAPWRVGQGNPAAYELLAGGGNPDFMILSVRLLRELIEGHRRFVFVASEPANRMLLTIGDAQRHAGRRHLPPEKHRGGRTQAAGADDRRPGRV